MIISNIKTTEKAIQNTNIVGNASCIINNTIAVNNITIRKNSTTNELYLQMPQMKNAKTGNYQDIVFPLNKECRDYLNSAIINQFFNNGKDVNQSIGKCSNDIICQLYNNTNSNTSVVANGSITIDNEWVVKGVKVVKSNDNKLFVALPSSYNKNTNKSYSIVSPASKEAYEKISSKALSEYQSINNTQSNTKVAPPAEKENAVFSYKELTTAQIEKLSKSTNVKFDCSPVQKNGNYIIRFSSNDKAIVENTIKTNTQAR